LTTRSSIRRAERGATKARTICVELGRDLVLVLDPARRELDRRAEGSVVPQRPVVFALLRDRARSGTRRTRRITPSGVRMNGSPPSLITIVSAVTPYLPSDEFSPEIQDIV
jgi:hypothetical protein